MLFWVERAEQLVIRLLFSGSGNREFSVLQYFEVRVVRSIDISFLVLLIECRI